MRKSQTNPIAAHLLEWYDHHKRALPWRALPGESADPYKVWLSEIMLQQTTVATVGGYFRKFLCCSACQEYCAFLSNLYSVSF